ncbi:phosphate/phosphite/phosphonate ABC transporter substrate-binding protein [Gracilibacillus salinarum]|uniref:Phosphate/phosphite/phosphonate ABC transporter substrate-binding protein n=1 Tax=Gracilibacillus salinarum TaxID=2932255 RepID=A0ABY4GKE2_9BACI|nr:phosphate/phosphite/phosphonate ABC transporter substrate-binding protein [Gracilibacillus salinarum]UOQ84747.1 phosphate/phosphite/phosphonate ABC transporter substrate-binding protein [Gracilibacillus salinarum]
MKSLLGRMVLPLLFVFILAACNNAEGATTAEAESGNGEWPESITLVQMPDENNPTEAATMHTSLKEHISEELGIEVQEFDGGSYAVGIEAMAAGNLDVMLASPMSYYQAKQKAGAELLVTPVVPGGTEYYTDFVTQADNEDINSLEDLKGTNFAFVNAASSSGYLYPKATLVQELDLDPDKIEQSGYFFENVVFSEGHPNSLMGVAMGDYEAAAVAHQVMEMMGESDSFNPDDIKVIGRTSNIPDASYIVRGDLPEDFKKALKDAFVSFENEEYFEALHGDAGTRFEATEADYYDPAIEMLDTINALEDVQE